VTVGGTTLNGNTASIAAGATVPITISGSCDGDGRRRDHLATADATNLVTETNESNNTFSQAIVVGRGPRCRGPSTRAEAALHGTLADADSLRTFGHTNSAPSPPAASRWTRQPGPVRPVHVHERDELDSRAQLHPGLASGGGQDATISLYINGSFAQKITLSSRNSWLYGLTDDTESLSNTRRRTLAGCSTSRTRCSPVVARGHDVKLQRDAGDSAAFYIIDFVDLEQVAAAACPSRPAARRSRAYGAFQRRPR